jgi:metal-responsive CopG/Arc/MetJ family transcriptional regulator
MPRISKERTVNVGPVRFPASMAGQLDELAEQLGHSRSSLIRHAMRQYVRDMAPPPSPCK